MLKYSPSTHEGLFLVVPATFPGRQEHLTVWDRSSMRFLLQHRWAAITSHVPPSDKRRKEQTTNYIESASQGWSRRAFREHLSSSLCGPPSVFYSNTHLRYFFYFYFRLLALCHDILRKKYCAFYLHFFISCKVFLLFCFISFNAEGKWDQTRYMKTLSWFTRPFSNIF